LGGTHTVEYLLIGTAFLGLIAGLFFAPTPGLRPTFAIIAGIVGVPMVIVGALWILIVAFREDVVCGLCWLLVPLAVGGIGSQIIPFIPVPEGVLPASLSARPGDGLYARRGGSAVWSLRDVGQG